MTMKTIHAVSLTASAFLAALTFDAASGFNAASAGECTSGIVERDGHQVETKCDPKTGDLIRELWLKDGKRDRADGPAFTLNDLVAGVRTEVWWKNDYLHRDDGPAKIRRVLMNNVITFLEWDKDGQTFYPSAEDQNAWLKKNGEKYTAPTPYCCPG